ncbi:MAG: peptidase MA family metallohydrolase [Chloroflexi bacterium]|nr:peptidase MA family metallohydrolase [Chloroflexota bacterium]
MKSPFRKLVVVILAAAALASPWDSGNAEAAAIEIVSSSVTSEFPEGFRIKAEVKAENEIESIAVRLRIGQQTRGAYEYLDFEKGTIVNSELFWRTSTSARYVPPGTIITYNFEVEDTEGTRVDTEPEQFIYYDARFDWEEVSGGPVSVAYHGPVMSRAETVLEAILDTLEVMGPILGAGTEDPIRVTMYNNVKEMLEALPPGSTTIRRELITEGQAFTQVGTLLTLGGGRLARGTASHEVTHILTHRAGDSIFGNVPSWLDEGLAEYGNVEPGFSYDIALDFAINTDRLLPITSMPVLPGDPEEVIIFYGQARSLVQYMIFRWGPEAMRELLAVLKSGTNMDDALTQVYGGDRLALENDWRAAIGAPEYIPPERGSARPTAIPRKEILPFSLTPQPQAETVGSKTEEPAPEARIAPVVTAPPPSGFVPQTSSDRTQDEEAKAEAAAQEFTPTAAVPEESSPTSDDGGTDGGGSACSRPYGARPLDASTLALAVGLAGLGFRRRLFR